MARLELQKSIRVTGVSEGRHISHVTSDRVCISDADNNLILTNAEGENLHHLKDIVRDGDGVHTVNGDSDLIYIDREYNINKLSTVNKVKSTLIKYTAPWRPHCVYSSSSTGDLLVGMFSTDTRTAKVTRYNSTGENIQTIQHNNRGQKLYILPIHITENRNGDVIVSDFLHAVVVTERGGRHRFSYRGPPSESGLRPRGICTDALSHILVCDLSTGTVQIIDKDGHLLSRIKTRQQGILRPMGLSHDDKTNLLWVGSFDKTVNIYRCIYRDSLTGLLLEDIKCKKHPRNPLGQLCAQCDIPLCVECISPEDHIRCDLRDRDDSFEEIDKKLARFPFEDIKCKKHPIYRVGKFCTQCDVPLCLECISSEDHSRCDLRYIDDLFEEIDKTIDGHAFLMCLLFSHSYKLNIKEGNWVKKYNAVANSFHFKKICEPFALTDLEKYKPVLKFNESGVSFSTDFFRNLSFLKVSKNSKFVDLFMTLAEKENIAEYCRSWNYQGKKDEVCCRLLPEKTEELLEKLGEDIFTHPTMKDQSIHEAVFRKFGIPVQIIMRGDKSVKNFTDNIKKGKTIMYHASGMIIGCAGSGKTTLLERLKGIDLEEIKKNINSTRGVEIHTDVFDVADSIKVNSSQRKQRFKISLDETSEQQRKEVAEHPVKVDDVEMQDNVEPVSVGGTSVKASYHEQTSRDDTNFQSTLFHEREGASSPGNAKKVIKDSQDFPRSSEFTGVLQIDINKISNDPEKKITIVDFAGQCAYYASHQIFLSPRAFFILVLNMEKKFDDKVGEEVCCQEGSIYKGWTHRDYLEFWMKSVHQYSSDKAPVLLIGTHSEEKTEKEKMMFFHEIWHTLEMKDKSLHRHLHEDRQFAVGFHDSESIEKIKLSIVNVVQNLNHWGEELPVSWVMFEKFFQEKKPLRILKIETLMAFNDALPQDIKLQADDINVMLQFFHDIREILYFNQEFLCEVIILDVQWFADAFKNVITDKNHAVKDLCRFASDWKKFYQTGELNDSLLSAIWRMSSNGYMEHKNDIMLYMEKLGLLAQIDDKKWYVPCMNKTPFPADSFKSYSASSILCYAFDVLPAGIFHRLVSKCMQIPWSIVTERGRPCIYQTAAVFMFEDDNILLGMTPTEIQLQVFVIEGKVDVSTCHKIKEQIDSILSILLKTFQTDFKLELGFKCKASGFCDNQESSVIIESAFTKPRFQCPSCPIERKHIINTNDITKFWKQAPEDESSISLNKSGYKSLTSMEIGESAASIKLPVIGDDIAVNFEKIRKLLQVGTEAVRICFDKFFPQDNLEKVLKDNETDMRKGQFRFLPPQLEILFPNQGGSNTGVSSLSLDITIMYKLLRNYSDIPPPGNGWGKEPRIVHITESDDIERIRLYRNKYCHDAGSNPVISDDVFKLIWTDLSQAIMRLSGGVLKRRINEINFPAPVQNR